MKDFLQFLRNVHHILTVVRPVLAVLFALMLVGSAVMSVAEGMD